MGADTYFARTLIILVLLQMPKMNCSNFLQTENIKKVGITRRSGPSSKKKFDDS